MRWAMVGSATRKARAISSVVSPPISRSVSAARPSGRRIGWQATKISPSSSSPMSSSSAASIASTWPASASSSSRATSACFAARIRSRRKPSMARRLPAAISQAPGLRGTPLLGHSASAATSASCASSSASPTSRTIRASPPMSRARSMRKTVSIARWVSLAAIPRT